MLRQLLSGPTASEAVDAGNMAMLSNVAATSLPFTTSSVSGTSELFSSTFAMLSEGDGIADAWEKPRVYENSMEEFARFGGDFGHPFDQTNRLPLLYPGQHPMLPPHAPIMTYGMQLGSAAAVAAAAAATPMSFLGHPQQAIVRPLQHGAFHPHLAAPIPIIAPQTAPVPALSGSPDDGRPHTAAAACSSSVAQQQQQQRCAAAAAAATPPTARQQQAAAPAAAAAASSHPPGTPSILCECCRGVYPSRRSLLGHIGRNEKCRAFVESMGAPGAPKGAAPSAGSICAISSESSTPPGAGSPPKPGMVSSTGEGGLSPICPYCERFISHYKGNIRRHINQCCKNGGKRLKTPKNPTCGGTSSTSGKRRKFAVGSDGTPSGEGWGAPAGAQPTSDMTLYEHITSNFNGSSAPPPPPPMVTQQLQLHPTQQPQTNPLYDLPPSTNSAESSNHPDSTTPPKKTSESDVPDDPYLCPYCDFLTVYKGNMKRHLNTCHPVEMEKGDRRLDDMRASVQGVANEELNAKLNAHKMNSTRGRKPKVGKLGMDTSGSGLSPNGNDHSLGSGGSSTTSPMSTTDPYYRPPVSGHMMPGASMMSYAPMGYPQAPQHLLMVAPPPPGYHGYHTVQQQLLQQPTYLQQAPPPPQQQLQSMPQMMTSTPSETTTTSRTNGMKKELKSEDESDFDEDEDESDDEGREESGAPRS